jgi:hypothetical protein
MFAVKMIITDNGSKIYRPYKTDLTESVVIQKPDFDLYIDVFDTYERAEQFYLANKEETGQAV